MVSRHLVLGCVFAAVSLPAAAADASDRAAIEALITKHAKAHGVPVSLVHRVVRRESNYNPRASHRGNLGLMQIRHGTARGMGYTGSAAGLLDADTNLSYAVPYLANAYRVAGGNENRAVSLYASGFYYHAKHKGMLGSLKKGPLGDPASEAQVAQVPAQPGLGSWLASAFSRPATQPQQVASVQIEEPVGRKHRSKGSRVAAAASSR
jgi:soluble lytic murein transglycosylase-like protein